MRASEKHPCRVILADRWTIRDPFDPADGDDLDAALEIWRGLPGENPVGVDQEPRRQQVRKVLDHLVQDRPRPWRVGDDEFCFAPLDQLAVECQSVALVDHEPVTGTDVAGIDAGVAAFHQMADQRSVARARLDESGCCGEMWQQRRYRIRRRSVVILRSACEG